MANLTVTPEYLEKIAKRQDEAASEAAGAASAAAGTGSACWLTHGVISGSSNSSIGDTESARQAAGNAIKQASVDLATKLRTAKETYTAVDSELGGNLDKQVLSK
jgi:Excreted virulence factor EspC, type VII ESX diderm